MIDLPGGGGNVPIGPEHLMSYDHRSGRALSRDYQGRTFEHFDLTERLPGRAVAAGRAPPRAPGRLVSEHRTATSRAEIGIVYDLKSAFGTAEQPGPGDLLEEYDEESTVDAIAAALKSCGYRPRKLGGGRAFLRNVLDYPPDLVFNIAEGVGTRSREAHVPSVLEMLGIPYTHSDPLTLAVCLDKAAAKRLVAAAGIPTPRFVVVRSQADVKQAQTLVGQVIAKPVREGSSMGIRKTSRTDDGDALARMTAALLADYGEPVLVEEFCPGPEFTVGIVEIDGAPVALGVMEIAPRAAPPDEFVYSLEVKRNYLQEVDYHVPPRQPDALVARVEHIALAAFSALECRDIARVDVRVGADGEPKFLEINPLPGLNPISSDLAILAHRRGLPYAQIIARIVASACARQGLPV